MARFHYYRNLNATDQRIYRQSDAVGAVQLTDPSRLQRLITPIEQSLRVENADGLEAACNLLTTALCDDLNVEYVSVAVEAARPASDTEDLYGLYEPGDASTYAAITVWMYTARLRKVVAFRTFLRTLLHEFCHHLDYELLGLEDSFHTQGFFERESSLFKQLLEPLGSE